MPGSDNDPDKIQTYGPDNSGKSKTSQIAPGQVGRENARTNHKARDVDAKTVQTETETIGPATTAGDIPLRISQDGSNPTFGSVLAENSGWPNFKSHRTTVVFDSVDDHVFRIGHNIDSSRTGAREDTNKPQFYDSWESSFDDGSNRKMERHFEGKFKDGSSFRAMGLKVRYADTDGNSKKRVTVSWPDVDSFNIDRRSDGANILNIDPSDDAMRVQNDMRYVQTKNNVPAVEAANSTGNTKPILKVGGGDKTRIGGTSGGIQFAGAGEVDFDTKEATEIRFIKNINLISDPSAPPNGFCHIFVADGSGAASEGDVVAKVTNSSGTSKTVVLGDFSAA